MENQNKSKEVGKRIKYLREKKGESQAQLGEAIGLSQNSISKIEKGDTQLTLENQFNIVKHFNISHDYLCTGRDTDSILDILKKYVSIKYTKHDQGKETFVYPVLNINKIFFDYLISSAHAQDIKSMPKDIKEGWLETLKNDFYDRNKDNSFTDFQSVVPLPEDLIHPDKHKINWKHSDLIREMSNRY